MTAPPIVQFNGGTLPTSTGIAAYNVWWTFTTPQAVPCSSDYFYGLRLPASTGWPNDGLSGHMADYTAGTTGDDPRASAPPLGWSVLTGAAPQAQAHVWNFCLGTATPTMQIGADNPGAARYINATGSLGFGAAGIYPDVSGSAGTGRSDGLSLRIHDNANVGGTAFGMFGVGYAPVALQIPPFAGAMSMDFAVLMSVGSAPITLDPLTGQSVAVIPVLAPGIIPPSVVGSSPVFSAITLGATDTHFTNSARVSF